MNLDRLLFASLLVSAMLFTLQPNSGWMIDPDGGNTNSDAGWTIDPDGRANSDAGWILDPNG